MNTEARERRIRREADRHGLRLKIVGRAHILWSRYSLLTKDDVVVAGDDDPGRIERYLALLDAGGAVEFEPEPPSSGLRVLVDGACGGSGLDLPVAGWVRFAGGPPVAVVPVGAASPLSPNPLDGGERGVDFHRDALETADSTAVLAPAALPEGVAA